MTINPNLEERFKVEIKALEAECSNAWRDVEKWMKLMLYASLILAPLCGLISKLFNDANFVSTTLTAFCAGVAVPWLFINLIFGYCISMRLYLLHELKCKEHVPDVFSNPHASNEFSNVQKIIMGAVFTFLIVSQWFLLKFIIS